MIREKHHAGVITGSGNMRAAAKSGDFRIHPRPEVLRFEFANRTVTRKNLKDLACTMTFSVMKVVAVSVKQIVRQMHESQFARAPADIVIYAFRHLPRDRTRHRILTGR